MFTRNGILLGLALLAACDRRPDATPPMKADPVAEPTSSAPANDAVPRGVPVGVGEPIDPDARTKPIEEVKSNAIYAPDPDTKRLAASAAAHARKPIKGGVEFCVGKDGVPSGIRTVLAVDDEVDQILRDTITKWRFKPFVLDGETVKTCTVATFDIEFK
jgi:periplasmic protein TonB